MRAVGIILAGGNNNRMKELSSKRAIAAMQFPDQKGSGPDTIQRQIPE